MCSVSRTTTSGDGKPMSASYERLALAPVAWSCLARQTSVRSRAWAAGVRVQLDARLDRKQGVCDAGDYDNM